MTEIRRNKPAWKKTREYRRFKRALQRFTLPGFRELSAYDIWKTYVESIIDGDISNRANSISWSFFLAIFPFLIFCLNLIPLAGEGFQYEFLFFLQSAMPPTTADTVTSVFTDIASKTRGNLLSISFLASIFFLTNGTNAIFDGFQNSVQNAIKRKVVRQYFVAMGVSMLLTIYLFVTITLGVYFEYLLETLRQESFLTESSQVFWIENGRYAFFIFMIYSAVATLYYFGTKDGRLTRFFSLGAFVTTLLIIVATWGFGIYIENFSTYNELYGSIGVLLILMIYVWINSNLLLLGFELNAAVRRVKFKQ